MRILIISDLHHRIDWVIPCLNDLKGIYDKVVFLGDYFDNWNDDDFISMDTAAWLHNMINTKDFGEMTFLFGNHDIFYSNPKSKFLCSGNTSMKARAINSKMTLADWKRLKLVYHIKDSYGREWYFSHAGLTEYHFTHPINGFYKDRVDSLCETALEELRIGKINNILGCGYARYGDQQVGGIVWCDWNEEFRPISDINQIVGHTIVSEPKQKNDIESENWNIDTNNRHVCLWDDGVVNIVENKWIKK